MKKTTFRRATTSAQGIVRERAASIVEYLIPRIADEIRREIADITYVTNPYRTLIKAMLLDKAIKASFGYESMEEYKEFREWYREQDRKCWERGEFEVRATYNGRAFRNTFYADYQLPCIK